MGKIKSNFEKPNNKYELGWDHYKKFATYIPIITYGFKSVSKLRITYGFESVCKVTLCTDLDPYVKSVLLTDFYIRIWICMESKHCIRVFHKGLERFFVSRKHLSVNLRMKDERLFILF